MPQFLPFYFVNMLTYSFLLLLIVILFPLIYTELCYVADYSKEFSCFVESFIPLIRVTGNPKQKLNLNFVTGLTNAVFLNRSYSSSRLSKNERNSFSINPDLQQVLIGLCLGDLCITKPGKNPRLQFAQGSINEAYILHSYDLFKDYCGSAPKLYEGKLDKRTGLIYSSIRFKTLSLPCFSNYYDLFYYNGVKRIPLNINELLTPLGLAYWAMDDGCKHNSGFHLCTDSYTFTEVQLLINVLKENFDLNCTYNKRGKDSHRIYIKSDSMDKFRSLVTPYFHESMMYKLTA